MRHVKRRAGAPGILRRMRARLPSLLVLRRVLVVAVGSVVASCATQPATPRHRMPPLFSQQMLREKVMNERWQDRSYVELVHTLGQPKRVMKIPGGGNPPSFAVVYGWDPVTGCIDAFAISEGPDPVVRVYHCR